MSEKRRVPKLRFPGFTDDWEQRKLSDVAEIIGGGTPSTGVAEYWDGDIDWYAPAEINDQIYVDGSERKITRLGLENSSAKILPANKTVLFTSRAGIGKTAILRHEGATNQGFQSMVLDDDTNPYFVFSMSSIIKDKAERVASGSTFAEISGKMLGNLEFMFPSKAEQDKIGAYFSNLDHLITLHQRELEHTKDLKKSLLQKMFPKNGERCPKIRFPGFTDDWEQRKLETVAAFSKGNGYSKGDLITSGTPIILYGRLYTKYETTITEVDTFVDVKQGSVYSKGGEVIIPASGETAEDIARASTVENAGILLGGDLNVVTPNEGIDSAFLALSISNGESHKELAKKAQGKSVVHIHNAEIMALNIAFPSKIEQSRISAYFSTLDHLITLHQRELEHLQLLKKGLLQQMFI